MSFKFNKFLIAGASAMALTAGVAQADQVIADDLIVQGSICAGLDCVNGESFGFDTIRLKENNVRIGFTDTSSSASFPTSDWEITVNDSSNGGANKFSITDISAGRVPFTIEGSSTTHALYVDSASRVGFGTSTPVASLHARDGNSPTLRLEQDGSDGFSAQIWDLAGNEANFFIRDVSNGSTLPFRVFPGASSNALTIAADNDVGMGIQTATSSLHVRRADGTAQLHVEEASSTASNARIQLKLTNNGQAQVSLVDSSTSADWRFQNLNSNFSISKAGTGQAEMVVDGSGNVTIQGTLTELSDKHSKMGITPVDSEEILQKVADLPVSSWTYIDDADTGVRHIGPMAQDFYAAFGTGHTDKGISSLDSAGVALAAIQALSQQNAELQARIDVLEDRVLD